MYKRILLASDETRESMVALREGALIARALGAEAFLLIVEAATAGQRIADGVYPAPRDSRPALELLDLGLTRLRRLGVASRGEVVFGEPAAAIAACAREPFRQTSSSSATAAAAWWSAGGRARPAPTSSTR
jgi:nucleotide-binding universal stress UspA family protein